MNTTINISDDILNRAMLAIGTESVEETVAKALEEFVKIRDQRSIIPLLGTLENFMTQEELEEKRRMD